MVKKETVEKWGIECIKHTLADDGMTVKTVYCCICRDYYSGKIGGMRVAHGLKGAVSSLADKWILGTEVIKKSNAIDHVTKSVVHKVAVVAQQGSITLSAASARGIVEVERQAAAYGQQNMKPGYNTIKIVPKITPVQRAQLIKKFQLLHYLVIQGKPLQDFEKFVNFEKDVHKVDLGSGYMTTKGAKNMCHFLAQNIKQDEVTKPMNSAERRYFSLMYDASTSPKTKEEKEVFVIKTCDAGKPSFQVMSVEEPDDATAHGLKKSLERSIEKQNFVFERKDHQVGNGCDGSAINNELFHLEQEDVGEHLIKGWCASHRSELGIHDAFKHGELNKASEKLVCNVFYLFKKANLMWRLFKYQSQCMNLKCLKYKRFTGSQWVKNQVDSLNNYLTNLPAFLAFLHQQLQSPFNKKIKEAQLVLETHLESASGLELLLYMAVKQDLLDYLSPFSQLLDQKLLLAPETLSSMKSAMQVITRIKHILDDQGSAGFYTEGLFPTLAGLVLPNLVSIKESQSDCETKADEKSADLQTFHGYEMTTELHKALNMVFEEIQEVLGCLEVNLTSKFSDIMDSPIYHSTAVFLDTKSYQYNSVDVIFESAVMVQEQFSSLLEANFCEVEKLRQEFSFLYTHVTTFLSRSTNEQAWQQLFASQSALSISNILHIAEICIVLPTSCACVERIFRGFSRIVSKHGPPLKNDIIENELILSSDDFDNFNPSKYDAIIDEFVMRHPDENIQPKLLCPSSNVRQKRPYKRKGISLCTAHPCLKKDCAYLHSEIKMEMQPEIEASTSLMDTMSAYHETPDANYPMDDMNVELNLDDSSFDSMDLSSDSEDNM